MTATVRVPLRGTETSPPVLMKPLKVATAPMASAGPLTQFAAASHATAAGPVAVNRCAENAFNGVIATLSHCADSAGRFTPNCKSSLGSNDSSSCAVPVGNCDELNVL